MCDCSSRLNSGGFLLRISGWRMGCVRARGSHVPAKNTGKGNLLSLKVRHIESPIEDQRGPSEQYKPQHCMHASFIRSGSTPHKPLFVPRNLRRHWINSKNYSNNTLAPVPFGNCGFVFGDVKRMSNYETKSPLVYDRYALTRIRGTKINNAKFRQGSRSSSEARPLRRGCARL